MLPEMEKREEKDQSYPVTPTGRPVVGLRSGPAAVPTRTGSFTRRELTQGERGAHDLALDPERERSLAEHVRAGQLFRPSCTYTAWGLCAVHGVHWRHCLNAVSGGVRPG